ncbi:MAG: hypothetical protein HZA54_10225 [Planctomycetes bacterium]|nr:hypothetical protein [Planctomycetota bacterium]
MAPRLFACVFILAFLLAFGLPPTPAPACLDPEAVTHDTPYEVVPVPNGGRVVGRVTWSRRLPDPVWLPIGKNPEACGGHGALKLLPRLHVSADKGVKDAVVYLSDVFKGKPFPPPTVYRLDQRACEYVPHVMVVPRGETVEVRSSDDVLHTVHMTGAVSANVALPGAGSQPARIVLSKPGLVELSCDNGHAWMSGSIVVAPHPYFAVSDAAGRFELADVPPGVYEVVAWHEGWEIDRSDQNMGVVTRYYYSRPVIKKEQITLAERATLELSFDVAWR